MKVITKTQFKQQREKKNNRARNTKTIQNRLQKPITTKNRQTSCRTISKQKHKKQLSEPYKTNKKCNKHNAKQ